MGLGYCFVYKDQSDFDFSGYASDMQRRGLLEIHGSNITYFDLSKREFVEADLMSIENMFAQSGSVSFYCGFDATKIHVSIRSVGDGMLVESYNFDVLNHGQKKSLMDGLLDRFCEGDSLAFVSSLSSDIDESDWDEVILNKDLDIEEEPDCYAFHKSLDAEYKLLTRGLRYDSSQHVNIYWVD